MSDRIAVMNAGRIVQIGTPEDIYTRPVNRFVAEFMGEVNVFPVRRRAGDVFEGTETPGSFKVTAWSRRRRLHRRASRIHAPSRAADEAENCLEAKLYNSYSLGSRTQYRLTAGTKALIVEQSRAARASPSRRQPCAGRLGYRRRAFRGD